MHDTSRKVCDFREDEACESKNSAALFRNSLVQTRVNYSSFRRSEHTEFVCNESDLASCWLLV